MDITFNCGWCGQQIVVEEAGAGLATDCPKCGQPLTVPSDEAPRAEPSATKQCPFCAETIKAQAIVCKHCGRDLVAKQLTETVTANVQGSAKSLTDDVETEKTRAWIALLYLLIGPFSWFGFAFAGGMPAPDGYVVGLPMPLFGLFAGIYLLAKKQAGHGVTCMAVSAIEIVIYLAVYRP